MVVYVKNRSMVGNAINRGDVMYYRDGLNQLQVQVIRVFGARATVMPKMTRHRETVDGRETGVWSRWDVVSMRTRQVDVRIDDLTKTADPVVKKER